MKKYIMYSNENTSEHIFERHDFGDVRCLTSEPENKERNDAMYDAHAMCRELADDKESLQYLVKGLDGHFDELQEGA
jgi:hypothetical protein